MRSFKAALAAASAAVALLGSATGAQAAQVYYADAGLAGNQPWSGTLGLDFDVLSSIVVTQLGAFDSNGDGITAPIFVTLRDAAGNNLLDPVSFANSTNAGGAAYILKDIAPIVLTPGRYQVAAWQYQASDLNYNYGFIMPGNGGPIQFNNLGGALAAVGTRYGFTPGGATDTNDNGTTRYGAGTFSATAVAAVPEPATWGLMIAGFGGAGAMLRRRRAATARAA